MSNVMLGNLQKAHAIWQHRNFPSAQKFECMVGVPEEFGELIESLIGSLDLAVGIGRLSHSFLKNHQGIRKNENHIEGMKDAVGDIVIYLLGFCTLNGLDIDECIDKAWNEVKDRDWTKK